MMPNSPEYTRVMWVYLKPRSWKWYLSYNVKDSWVSMKITPVQALWQPDALLSHSLTHLQGLPRTDVLRRRFPATASKAATFEGGSAEHLIVRQQLVRSSGSASKRQSRAEQGRLDRQPRTGSYWATREPPAARQRHPHTDMEIKNCWEQQKEGI